MKNKKQIPAIVIGGGVTALGVMRALRRLGIPAYSTASKPDLVAYSNAYRPREYTGAPLFADLPAYLRDLEFHKAVLIPCSDSAVRQVASLDETQRVRFPSSTSPVEHLACYLDKKTMYQKAQELGVPHPRTVAVENSIQLRDAFSNLDGDLFLKPRNSESFFSKFGIKAVRITADSEGLTTAQNYLASGEPLLVQEYIAGSADRHLFIDGFVDRDGIFRAWFLRRRLRMYPPFFGNSSYMQSIDMADEIEAVRVVQLYLQGTKFRGVFSAELKNDPKDATFKLIEINPRPWWFISFAEQCGVPITALAYRDALELPLQTVHRYRTGEVFLHPYYDFFACLDLYKQNRITLARWVSDWNKAGHSFACLDDIRPQLRGFSGMTTGILRYFKGAIKERHANKL